LQSRDSVAEIVTSARCRLDMRSAILVTIVVITSARATAAPRLHGTLAVIDPDHAKLTLVVGTMSRVATGSVARVELPAGMKATALTVATEIDTASWSIAVAPETARTIYNELVAPRRDPAMLEYWSGREAILSVFPVRRDAPATVVIELVSDSVVYANDIPYLDVSVSLIAAPYRPLLGEIAGWEHHERSGDRWIRSGAVL
jgi:hypothetical protein